MRNDNINNIHNNNNIIHHINNSIAKHNIHNNQNCKHIVMTGNDNNVNNNKC